MSTSVNTAASKHPRVTDSTFPEERDEQVRNLPGDKCPHCNQVCTIESEAIQCNLCSNWVHAHCEGISSELYKSFSHVSSGIANVKQKQLWGCKKLVLPSKVGSIEQVNDI